MTESATGRVVASVPLQKQIFGSEIGFSTGRFFGSTLVSADIGGMEREALNFALRQMVSLATFELVAQMMQPRAYLPCRSKIDDMHGVINSSGTAEVARTVHAALEEMRRTDPRSAMILERELAGENIDAIMASLGEAPAPAAEPGPGPVAAAPMEPVPPVAATPRPASDAPTAGAVPRIAPIPLSEPTPLAGEPAADDDAAPGAEGAPPPPAPEPEAAPERREELRRRGVTGASLPVRIGEHDGFTRVVIDGPVGADIRWGVNGRNLIVVAKGRHGAFDLSATAAAKDVTRIAKLRAGGNDDMQALELTLTCDCGARTETLPDGRVVIDITQGAPRPALNLAAAPSGPLRLGWNWGGADRLVPFEIAA